MSNKNLNCCNIDNSDCNTQETNCCTAEKKTSSNKKKLGLAILLTAITFAVIFAFNSGQSTEKSSCSSEETGCSTSCDTAGEEVSCCSKK